MSRRRSTIAMGLAALGVAGAAVPAGALPARAAAPAATMHAVAASVPAGIAPMLVAARRGPQAGGVGAGTVRIPAAVPGATTSASVKRTLAYLIEEEKLAGDIYDLAAARYGMRVFANIGRAEDSHAAAVRVLLSRYGVADPTAGKAPGAFTNKSLRTLYKRMARKVRTSRAKAIRAAIAIERADIADLKKLLAKDLPPDVERVARNLLRGSRRHLAAFKRQL